MIVISFEVGRRRLERANTRETGGKMNDPNILVSSVSEAPQGWQRDAVQNFESRLLDEKNPFPCIFGAGAMAQRTLRFGFVADSGGQDSNLAHLLTLFTRVCRDLGNRTSLVCFFESWTVERNHDAYFRHFWELLHLTSTHDDDSWPAQVDPHPENALFEFSFGGEAMFVVANTDLHFHRKSRYFERVTLTFQPRFVFDGLEAGGAKGNRARSIIRARLATYDAAPVSEQLGNYGDSNNREWRQYYLDDGQNSQIPSECPVHTFSPRAGTEV